MLLGIDLGTSGVKCLLITEQGDILASANETYPLYMPKPGWSEQKPEDWWAAVCRAIHQLGKRFNTHEITGISFAGQMHGLVILDQDDHVIRPAILWNDTRTGEEVAYLNEEVGRKVLIQETGNIAYAGFTAPKLLWMQKHEPDLFNKIDKIMLPKDYLVYRLTNRHVTDYSDAAGMLLLDVKNKTWSEKMLDIFSIKKDMLAELHESYEHIGTVSPQAAQELHLSEACVVAPGAGDNAAAAIGTDTLATGQCNISLGTSGTILIASDEFISVPNSELHSFNHANGKYMVMGVVLAAATANKWWIESILEAKSYAFIDESNPDLGENRVFFMPYMTGERSPHNDEDIRGGFLGLSLSTDRLDMSQAVLEGVSFALRDCLEIARQQGIEVTKATVTGGGAKSKLWKRILANVLNLEIEEVSIQEGPSLGAAILAGVANGSFSDPAVGAKLFVKKQNSITPSKEIVEKYDAQYKKFTSLYPSLCEFYRK